MSITSLISEGRTGTHNEAGRKLKDALLAFENDVEAVEAYPPSVFALLYKLRVELARGQQNFTVATAAQLRGMAGYRQHSANRYSLDFTVVFKAREAGYDPAGGPWATVCMAHATIANSSTLKLAIEASYYAPGFCEDCRAAERKLQQARDHEPHSLTQEGYMSLGSYDR